MYGENRCQQSFIQARVMVLSAINSMLISQQCSRSRKEEREFQSVHRAILESDKVTYIMGNEGMEKMEKQLNFWTHDVRIDF